MYASSCLHTCGLAVPPAALPCRVVRLFPFAGLCICHGRGGVVAAAMLLLSRAAHVLVPPEATAKLTVRATAIVSNTERSLPSAGQLRQGRAQNTVAMSILRWQTLHKSAASAEVANGTQGLLQQAHMPDASAARPQLTAAERQPRSCPCQQHFLPAANAAALGGPCTSSSNVLVAIREHGHILGRLWWRLGGGSRSACVKRGLQGANRELLEIGTSDHR
jgi:hypothetical protein